LQGDALIAALPTQSLVAVAMDGTNAREEARYAFPERLRAVVEAPDGSRWMAEDKEGRRLLRLTPSS
jgi:aldose sugar dehydrogenase